jgi:hypothetical protein
MKLQGEIKEKAETPGCCRWQECRCLLSKAIEPAQDRGYVVCRCKAIGERLPKGSDHDTPYPRSGAWSYRI